MPNGGLRQVLAWSRGPPHVSHTSGPSITKHWRTTPIRRRLSSPQTTIILHWPPPRPPPPAHLPHHGSEALSAHLLHEDDGSGAAPLNHPPDGGPCHPHHPTMQLRRWTRTPPRHRTGTGPSSHDHHTRPATFGTPAWGRTTANQPLTALVPRRTHCEIRGLRPPHSEGGLLS